MHGTGLQRVVDAHADQQFGASQVYQPRDHAQHECRPVLARSVTVTPKESYNTTLLATA